MDAWVYALYPIFIAMCKTWGFSPLLCASLPLGCGSLCWAHLTASQSLFPQHIVSHPIIFMSLLDFLCQHICCENNSPWGQIVLIFSSCLK